MLYTYANSHKRTLDRKTNSFTDMQSDDSEIGTWFVISSLTSLRDFCVNELCIVMHSDANQATGAPLTH